MLFGIRGLRQCGFEPVAKAGRQHFLWQEEVAAEGGRHQRKPSARKPPAGTTQWTWGWNWSWRPQVWSTLKNAQFSAEVFCAGGDVLQGGGAFAQQQCVALFLMGAQPGAQAFGHGEGDQVIGDRQELEFLAARPIRRHRPGRIGDRPGDCRSDRQNGPGGSRRSDNTSPPSAGVRQLKMACTARR